MTTEHMHIETSGAFGDCPTCEALRRLVEEQKQEIAQLHAIIDDLESFDFGANVGGTYDLD